MAFAEYENLTRWLCYHEQADGPAPGPQAREHALALLALKDLDKLLASGDREAFSELAALRTRYRMDFARPGDRGDEESHLFETD